MKRNAALLCENEFTRFDFVSYENLKELAVFKLGPRGHPAGFTLFPAPTHPIQ